MRAIQTVTMESFIYCVLCYDLRVVLRPNLLIFQLLI